MTIQHRMLDSRGERRVTAGSCALWLGEYVREPTPNGPVPVDPVPVPGLQVRVVSSGQSALFHPSSGIYGYTNLRAGEHELLVTDPTGQRLPLLHVVTVADRSALVQELEAGARPASQIRAPIFARRMRPAPGCVIAPGQTIITGSVVDAADAPVPWAVVRLHIEDARPSQDPAVPSMDWVGLTDGMGSFLLWLRDLTNPDPEALHGTLTLRQRPPTVLPKDPLAALADQLCPNIDVLAAGGGESEWFSGSSASVGPFPIRFGTRDHRPPITLS